MRSSFFLPLILFLTFAFSFGIVVYLEELGVVSAAEIEYVLLEPIPDGGGGTTPTDRVNVANFPEYVNNIIRLIIGISAVLAVLMITIGGFKYMIGGAESLGTKQEGREQIQNAILGFLLLLGCYFILSIINPDLLRINLTPTKVGKISSPSNESRYVITDLSGNKTETSTAGSCTQLRLAQYQDGATCFDSVTQKTLTRINNGDIVDEKGTPYHYDSGLNQMTPKQNYYNPGRNMVYESLGECLESFTSYRVGDECEKTSQTKGFYQPQ